MVNTKKNYIYLFFIFSLGVFLYFQETTPCKNKKLLVDINKSKIIDNNKTKILEKLLVDINKSKIIAIETVDKNHNKSKILKDEEKNLKKEKEIPPLSWNTNLKNLREEIIYTDDTGTYFNELDNPILVPLGENDKPILTKNAIITKNGIYFLDELDTGDIIDGKEFTIEGDNIFLK